MAKIAGGNGSALFYVLRGRVLKRNILIALVVGCLLSLINQLDILFSDPFTVLLGTKLFLNFLVPFVVSSLASQSTGKANELIQFHRRREENKPCDLASTWKCRRHRENLITS